MTNSSPASPLPRGRWIALIAAILGWMFDGFEMGLFPLLAHDSLSDLLGTNDKTDIAAWIAIITATFLIGAASGGVLFGWLGDRIGRVRAMTLSILTYALFSGLCGLAPTVELLTISRFIASLGMGGEWSLGVALVMELWPNRSRAWLAGVIGAAANFGYMIVGVIALGLNEISRDLHQFLLSSGLSQATVEWLTAHSGWRLLMMCGAAPALLTFLIRLFVPESHKWEEEKAKGSTNNWQTRDLLGVALGATAACSMIALWNRNDWSLLIRIVGSLPLLTIVLAGYLYPIMRFVQRTQAHSTSPNHQPKRILKLLLLAACLSGVALLGTWGSTQNMPTWAAQLTQGRIPEAKIYTQMLSAFGATIGCVIAAMLGELLGRRITYALLCFFSLLAIWNMYQLNYEYGTRFLISAFFTGAITASFYGWLPLYLPELFPTKIRAAGQGFGFNFGRVLSAVGVLQLPVVMRQMEVGWPQACAAMSGIYILGILLICFAPETKGKPLPE
jgi:SHS family sialic acid transporter-like MFS transporter